MTTDSLDYAMGLVVNDHDDVAETFATHSRIVDVTINEAIDAYVATALWAGTTGDDAGTPLDQDYDAGDIHADAMQEIRDDVRAFMEGDAPDVEAYLQQRSAGDLGHDFYLTRNRHGAGFWDGRVADDSLGRALTESAHAYGTSELSPDDDGRLYVSH